MRERVFRVMAGGHERWWLQKEKFVVVTNNCWGFEIYQTLKRGYNTPFVGLYLYPECYLKLLENLEYLVESGAELEFLDESRHVETQGEYPVGVIFGNVEIHFLHYKSEEEARDKWTRRLERMREALDDGAKLLIKMCDRDQAGEAEIRAFHELDVVKKNYGISFGVNSSPEADHVTVAPKLREEQTVQDEYGKPKSLPPQVVDGVKLYEGRYRLFDFCDWVRTGRIRKTLVSKVLGALKKPEA